LLTTAQTLAVQPTVGLKLAFKCVAKIPAGKMK